MSILSLDFTSQPSIITKILDRAFMNFSFPCSSFLYLMISSQLRLSESQSLKDELELLSVESQSSKTEKDMKIYL